MEAWHEVFRATGLTVMSRAALRAWGATGHSLTAAVQNGYLIRVRRDHYCLPDVDRNTAQAIRVGGRLGCIGALRSYGVFVFDASCTHVHLDRAASRLRSPRPGIKSLAARRPGDDLRDDVRLHWWPLHDPNAGDECRVGLLDALAQSLRCQHPSHAIASIDNALHQRMITEPDVDEVFRRVPHRYLGLRDAVDGRAEAGQETVPRMIVREAGLKCEPQVAFPRIGRVDMVVEGCTILEADSRAHHGGWEAHVRDRGRDLALAKIGYSSLRPAYQHTMHHPELVRDAILGLVAAAKRA